MPAGAYTAQISGASGTTGVALVEVYDADPGAAPSRLVNLSARADVAGGSGVLAAGFVISGSTSETVLIRGIGPALGQFNLSGVLAAPQLTLFDSNDAAIATNTGWSAAPVSGPSSLPAGIQTATAATMASVGAFSLPVDSGDCALVATLPPGSYTAQVSGLNGSAGIALVEVYEIP